MKPFLVTFLTLIMLAGSGQFSKMTKIPRIGIIGGGIGGTSCAYFLKSLLGEKGADIDLFEAETIGGRLSVVNFSNNLYEEGGSIIHSRNKYMVNFLKEFNLQKRQSPSGGHFGLYDGNNFVFSESDWQIKTLWDVVYRYGFGFWKLREHIEDMLAKFDRIYELQKNGVAYNTVGSMLAAMDPNFVNYLHTTTKYGFESQGISQIVVDEIVMATTRANYGQNVNIQKMVGSVSVAGAVGSLWSVEGGNVKVPENLLKASKARLIKLPVVSLRQISSGQIELTTKSTKETETEKNRIYDFVVIAAPQTSDSKYKIKFQNFTREIEFPGRYHKTVCTLIEGNLSEKYFSKKSPIIDEILTIKDSVSFNSIGRITPVDYTPEKYSGSRVWKIFTQNAMTDSMIDKLFTDVRNKYVREWLAYPHYDTSVRNDSFVLAPNVFHINAVEWAASAMEMSVIGAKNVALLIYQRLACNSSSGSIRSDPVFQGTEEL